ncbi:LETM1 domain-containing protein 1-like [Actinia tenebrosa]|uniref:LETM1 domain-containing protein 1-like n=1 Tax=Actinia tenebrosa TaxID=6105 RepID=A0A6P8ISS5_ACTTE|nr:LETM1 domain-containing protein 1-like [Actinia tenebrosa]
MKTHSFYLPSGSNISVRNDLYTFLRPLGSSWYHINEVHGSSIARSTRKNGNGKSEGNGSLHQFRRVMKQFVSGSKDLGSDVKRLVAIRKKLRASGKDWNALTVDETLHLHQMKSDLLKTLPAVFVFCIPFIGYAAPLIAFMYPKHLLSHHYWLPSQEEKFIKHDAAKRRSHYLPLVREVGRYALQEKGKEPGKEYEKLFDVSIKTINKGHPTNEELLKSSDKFTEDKLGFNELPKFHLKKLSQAWLIFPWLPRRLLRGNLKRRITAIRKEDFALKREGLETLDDQKIRRLCHRRGLDVSNLDTEALKKWLMEWVELSTSASGQGDSFLAHIAVYKTMNYHRHPASPTSPSS